MACLHTEIFFHNWKNAPYLYRIYIHNPHSESEIKDMSGAYYMKHGKQLKPFTLFILDLFSCLSTNKAGMLVL